MPQQVQTVVALKKGEPVELVTIPVPDPGPGEAVVQVQACGVCHTDLHYREGGINDDFPFLLGHEASGIVEAVGEGVTSVAPGDFVVLNWRAVCDDCRACDRGEPWYCFNTHNATQKMTLADGPLAGTELSPALGIGAFAEKTSVADGQCTKVDPLARPAAVGLLGCGGVGVAAIAGSALAGASPIIAVDIDPKKLEQATTMGATHTVDSSKVDGETGVASAIQELTGGNGADVVIEAVGRPETWKQAFYARDLAGTVVLVGVPTPDMKLPDVPLIDVFGRGGSLKSSWYGDCLPSRDFPMLVDLYQQGRLDLDAFQAVTVMDPFHVVRVAGDALDQCRRRVQQDLHGHRGRKNDPLYTARRTLHTGAELLTEKQSARLSALFASDAHVEVEVTWGVYQNMIGAYRHPDRTHGKQLMATLIDGLADGVPTMLTELTRLGHTLKQRADDVLAYFDRPGTSNGPTEAINGRLEHLRGSALGFRNLTNYIARCLLETRGFRPQLHPRL